MNPHTIVSATSTESNPQEAQMAGRALASGGSAIVRRRQPAQTRRTGHDPAIAVELLAATGQLPKHWVERVGANL